jgi:hypothetical protein
MSIAQRKSQSGAVKFCIIFCARGHQHASSRNEARNDACFVDVFIAKFRETQFLKLENLENFRLPFHSLALVSRNEFRDGFDGGNR